MSKQLAPIIGAALLAAIGIGSAAMAIRAHGQQSPAMGRYTVQVDVYVRDRVAKCLSAAYQIGAPTGVVSAGIDVREVRR